MATTPIRAACRLAAEARGSSKHKHIHLAPAARPSRQLQQQARKQHTTPLPRPHRRRLHSTAPKEDVAFPISTSTSAPSPSPTAFLSSASQTPEADMALSALRLSQVLRTWLITSMSSRPALLGASTQMLRKMLESNNPVFDLRNPVMKMVLWETFYKQFCAGENKQQVAQACAELREQGYAGVILEYALEVLKDAESDEATDVATWRKGMLDTVDIAASGDFLGLKWSGMGPAAMRRMKNEEAPSRAMEEAMHALCKAAAAKNISLLPAAEETWSLNGFHKWCLDLQRAYNIGGKSVVYGTYQAYLKQNTGHLAKHLQMARDDGFTLGVKLVRGAYLGSEKRDLIWPNIEGTHHAYDTTTSALVHRKYNELLKPVSSSEAFPDLNVVIASHNSTTVQKTQAWRQEQAFRGEELTPLVYAQLQGMADEVSCTLLANARTGEGGDNLVKEKVFKCTTWGTMFECLNYLLRRAAENKDAASRTVDTRDAMRAELGRRMKGAVGLA